MSFADFPRTGGQKEAIPGDENDTIISTEVASGIFEFKFYLPANKWLKCFHD